MSLAVGIAVCVLARVAVATSDGGTFPRLLAFAGADERWAIVALESVQEPCGVAPCKVVAIDLQSASYQERWPYVPAIRSDELAAETLVQRFVSASDDGARKLTPLRLVGVGGGRELPAQSGRVDVESYTLTLQERRRVASMRPYSRGSQSDCGAFSGDRCSSCEERTTTINGDRLKTWACEDVVGTFAQSGAPCDCHAEGRILALGGGGFVSREILVAPYRLAQNVMNGPGAEPDAAVALREARWHRSAAGVTIVLAGAVHAPMANGTWFPLIAYRPGKRSDPSDEPATPMIPSEGHGVTVEARPAPGASGCAGCSASRRGLETGWLVSALWVLAARARRRR